MSKELEITNRELVDLAGSFADVFLQRRDLYALQLADGRYACVRKPLKAWHIWKHLEGVITLGAYLLDNENRTRFVVIDADDEDGFQGLILAQHKLATDGATTYLETSRRGGHLWMFLSGPVPGKEARAFGNGIMAAADLSKIEIFPKQATLKDGPGSLIRLPFGIHRKTGKRYGFVDLAGEPLASTLPQQIRILCNPVPVPKAIFDAYCIQRPIDANRAEIKATGASQEPLSKRIKDSISVFDFINQYVQLAPNGVGLCPFHHDETASFAVDPSKNYWHCFAGCGGGSIIDFWMKWRKCDFKQAVKELAALTLKPS